MTLVLWLRPSFTNDLKIFELHNPKNGTLQDDVSQVLRIASLISLSASQILAKNLLHLPCVELRVRDTALRYLYKAANPGFPCCHRGIHVDTSITICVSNSKWKAFWKAESYRAFRLREMGSSEFAVAKKTSKCNFLQGKHRIDFTIIASHSMVCNQIQRNVKNTRKIHQAHLVLRQGGQQNHNQSWWIRMETRGSKNWDFLQVFEWFHTASEWSKPGLQVQPIMAQAARTAMELDELMREASDREAFSADSPVNLFLSCRMPRMLLRHEENWTDAGFTLGWLLDYAPQEKVNQKSQSVYSQFPYLVWRLVHLAREGVLQSWNLIGDFWVLKSFKATTHGGA